MHPDVRNVHDHVKQVLHILRTGKQDMFQLSEPQDRKNVKWVVNNYQAMHDESGNYRGTNEIVLDFWPIVKKYLEMTGQKLVDDPDNAVDTGASASVSEDDETSADTTPDTNASASVAEETPVEEPATDTDASASVADDEGTANDQPENDEPDTGASVSVK